MKPTATAKLGKPLCAKTIIRVVITAVATATGTGAAPAPAATATTSTAIYTSCRLQQVLNYQQNLRLQLFDSTAAKASESSGTAAVPSSSIHQISASPLAMSTVPLQGELC